MFCLRFPLIITSKCINQTYVLAVYTLNTPSTPYFFVYNRLKLNICLSCFFCPLKDQFVRFSYFETSKFLGGTFFVVCLLLYTLFLLFLQVIASVEPILFHFKLQKHYSCFGFSVLRTVDVFYCFFSHV